MDWQETSGGEHCFLRFRGLEMVRYLRQFTLIIILTRLIADFTASDALVVAELTHLKYPIPGIKMDGYEVLPSGHLRPLDLIISSPNANWIPNVLEDDTLVCVRMDGSFYTADFTKVPQLYFQGTYYLPYVLCRPPSEVIVEHPSGKTLVTCRTLTALLRICSFKKILV